MTWPADVEGLKPGDKCLYRYPARNLWHRATVVKNGGPGYWRVHNDEAGEVGGLYIEYIRAPGSDDAHPLAEPAAEHEPCAFGPEGEHHGGELVACAVCGRPTCDYCGTNEGNSPFGDWLCPDCDPVTV